MKYEIVLNLLFIFLIYSFFGWTLEVITVIIKEKRFVNRGITNGPLCILYGIAAWILTLITNDDSSVFSIFIASIIYGSMLELIAGKLLERINKNKWWDYSNKKFNLDGYICLQYSLLWGILGVILVKILNPFFLLIFNKINIFIRGLFVFILIGIIILDLITSFITLKSIKENKIEKVTNRFGNWLLTSISKRLEIAYPNIKKKKRIKNKDDNTFAPGCSFYKLFLIFLIGAFLGDIIEVLYCRYSMHRFMSRSSLIWGQFSLVWGLAIALATLLLYRYQNKSNIFLFIFGSIMGGAYEYICSVFTEFFFGTIFWDYSKIPFNINGRINLIFCIFWGLATIIFIKLIYPFLSRLIESIPKRCGVIISNILFIFIIIDLLVTGCVMMRYHTRIEGIEATNIVEKLCDKYADDDFMRQRWSNMKLVKK